MQGQKDTCPLSSTAQSTSGPAAPGQRAKPAVSWRGSFQLPFAGPSLTPLGPPCRADRDCSQPSGHGCTAVFCRCMLSCTVTADARSSTWMPPACRMLQTVPRHMAARPTAPLSRAGKGQDTCQQMGRGFEEPSHRTMQRARLFLSETRCTAVLLQDGTWQGLFRSQQACEG